VLLSTGSKAKTNEKKSYEQQAAKGISCAEFLRNLRGEAGWRGTALYPLGEMTELSTQMSNNSAKQTLLRIHVTAYILMTQDVGKVNIKFLTQTFNLICCFVWI
jgi:hypothetical protein